MEGTLWAPPKRGDLGAVDEASLNFLEVATFSRTEQKIILRQCHMVTLPKVCL